MVSDKHPEIVVKTVASQDDVRLSTTSDERYFEILL